MQPAHTTDRIASRRETLARVTQQLENAIEEAGSRNEPRLPPERELAHTLGVSRATVREAIQRLIAKGMIDSRHGRGLFIRDAPAAPMMSDLSIFAENSDARSDTLEFRLVVECAAARLAAGRASDTELIEMHAILHRMSDAVSEGDVEAEALADTQFHLALVKASHNRMLGTLCTNAAPVLRRHIAQNTLQASVLDSASHRLATTRLEQHRAIYEAVRTHRPQAASDAMKAHIEFIGQQFGDEP